MLSGLLKNEVTIEVSIKIVEAFVEIKKFDQVFDQLQHEDLNIIEKI